MFFVLGGNDAEMTLISGLLSQTGIRFIQPNMGWGDHKYTMEDVGLGIVEPPSGTPALQTAGEFDMITFVECSPAPSGWPRGTRLYVVDHHGDRAGDPSSVAQVLRILENRDRGFHVSEATRRWIEVIGANDAGYIPAMVALGATTEEMTRVRSLERLCQGITPEQEAEAERALTAPAEFIGPYRVIRLSHSKCATVNDRLFVPGRPERTLILSGDGEVNLFGDGETCLALKEKFEGWAGGSGLGKTEGQAYWGGYPPHEAMVQWLAERFQK